MDLKYDNTCGENGYMNFGVLSFCIKEGMPFARVNVRLA